MEHRSNDLQLLASLDAGHQSLPWEPGQAGGLLAPLDLAAIAASPNVADIVPSLPVQALYYALKQESIEEVLEILPFVSQEQTERMLDFEAWSKDELIPRKMLQFIALFGEVSPELMAERFSELDEEYQLACVQGKFRIYEAESIMDLPDELQERVYAMPCGKVFYEILTEDPDEKVLIEKLLVACQEYNLRYAYSLVSHASFMPPVEQVLVARQFRKARLEEEGFVSFEESQELFLPFDGTALRKKWSRGASLGSAIVVAEDELSFIDRVFALAQSKQLDIDRLFQIHQGFLYLANAMCAATQTEVYEATAIHRLMEQGKILVNLGLESLAEGDVEQGLEVLLVEPARVLFRLGLSLVDELRHEVLQVLKTMHLPRSEHLANAFHLRQWGRMLLEIDRHWLELVGIESAETLKGLFNRFPMRPLMLDSEKQRLVFVPLSSGAELKAFRHSLATMLGYFAAVVRTGRKLDQPFEIILRMQATENLGRGAEGSFSNPEADIPQLLDAWRDGLRKTAGQWILQGGLDLDEVLDDVCALIHEGLHGLIILPQTALPQEKFADTERML